MEPKSGSRFVELLFAPFWLLIKGAYAYSALAFLVLLGTLIACSAVQTSQNLRFNEILATPQRELNINDRYRDIYHNDVKPNAAGLSPAEMLQRTTQLYALEQSGEGKEALLLIFMPIVLLHLVVAMNGREAVQERLVKRGFKPIATVSALTNDAAIGAIIEQEGLPRDTQFRTTDPLGVRILVGGGSVLLGLIAISVLIPAVMANP